MHATHRRNRRLVRGEPECGHEAEEPEHPQRIVTEGDLGIEGTPQHLTDQIGQTAVRVDHLGETVRCRRNPYRHRIDREVTAGQVGDDVVGERHHRFARVVAVHLAAERRDLVDVPVADGADRPERLPGQIEIFGPRSHDLLDLVRSGVGGEVEVLFRFGTTDQRIPNRAPDQIEHLAGGAEAGGELTRGGGGVEKRFETGRDHRAKGRASHRTLRSRTGPAEAPRSVAVRYQPAPLPKRPPRQHPLRPSPPYPGCGRTPQIATCLCSPFWPSPPRGAGCLRGSGRRRGGARRLPP